MSSACARSRLISINLLILTLSLLTSLRCSQATRQVFLQRLRLADPRLRFLARKRHIMRWNPFSDSSRNDIWKKHSARRNEDCSQIYDWILHRDVMIAKKERSVCSLCHRSTYLSSYGRSAKQSPDPLLKKSTGYRYNRSHSL